MNKHNIPRMGVEILSEITSKGELKLTVAETVIKAPEENEVVVQIKSCSINPSDIGLLLGSFHVGKSNNVISESDSQTILKVPDDLLKLFSDRFDQPLPMGGEGSGTVVAAGAGAEHLLGRTVSVMGSNSYASYRTISVNSCMPVSDDISFQEAASAMVNPLTAMLLIETMKHENHSGMINTAAASNLGQMLVRLCKKKGIPLVNIVRSEKHVKLLREMGADFVCNSQAESFKHDLVQAIDATNATIAFDAVGGGDLQDKILHAMEVSIKKRMPQYSRYGSTTSKKLYIYGGLSGEPTTLTRTYGMAWNIGGWMLMEAVQKIGIEKTPSFQKYIVENLQTIFSSEVGKEISLKDVIRPRVIAEFSAMKSGNKYFINPLL